MQYYHFRIFSALAYFYHLNWIGKNKFSSFVLNCSDIYCHLESHRRLMLDWRRIIVWSSQNLHYDVLWSLLFVPKTNLICKNTRSCSMCLSTVSTRWQSHSITEEFNKRDSGVTVASFWIIHHKFYYKMDNSDLEC